MVTKSDINFVELIDLSLGTPEVVNYKGLRVLLAAIVSQLGVGSVKLELTDGDKKELNAVRESYSKAKEAAEKGKDGTEMEKTLARPATGRQETSNVLTAGDMDKSKSIADAVTLSAPGGSVPKVIQDMEEKMSRIEGQLSILNALPSNESLRARSGGSEEGNKTTPVSDMWQLMQCQRKATANEEGVSKLMSMVEDLMRELQGINHKLEDQSSNISDLKNKHTNMQKEIDKINEYIKSVESRMTSLEASSGQQDKIDELNKLIDDLRRQLAGLPHVDEIVTWPAFEAALKGAYKEPIDHSDSAMQTAPMVDHTRIQTMPLNDASAQTSTPIPPTPSPPPSRPVSSKSMRSGVSTASAHPTQEIQRVLRELGELTGRHNLLEDRVSGLEELLAKKADISWVEDLFAQWDIPGDLAKKLAELEEGLNHLRDSKAKLDELEKRLQDQSQHCPASLDDLTTLRRELEQALADLAESQDALARDLSQIGTLAPTGQESAESSGVDARDDRNLADLQSAISQLQDELEKLNKSYIHLVDEHNVKQKHIDALYTFVDRLQENKADKEHVIMEIDVKADKRALDNKVSRSHFDGTVDELSKNLNDVMEKMAGHRVAWDSAVGSLKLDIDNKLDRMELDPLKSYLDNRIKAVSSKYVKKEVETGEDAAGFRRPLQKFHCISCDRPLDMASQAPMASLPESKGLAPNRTGRPYTTFELEQIRAAQKNGNYQDVPDYFVASRSCGGSHTMTFPHRRITRVSQTTNLVTTTEDITPVVNGRVEADIQGQDGHIYKGRLDTGHMTERLPTLTQPKMSRAKSPRVSSARGRRSLPPSRQAAEPVDNSPLAPMGTAVSRPTSARNGNRPTSARPSSARPPSSGSPGGRGSPVAAPANTVDESGVANTAAPPPPTPRDNETETITVPQPPPPDQDQS